MKEQARCMVDTFARMIMPFLLREISAACTPQIALAFVWSSGIQSSSCRSDFDLFTLIHMTSYQLRILAAFSRTDEFFKSTGANLLTGPKNLELIAELGQILSKLQELSPVQKRKPEAVKGNTQGIKRLADELRHELLKVARTARALEDEAPDLRARFAMPRSPGFSALRKTARAVIANSSPEIQKLFIEAELQPGYLEVISRKLQNFESELANKTDGRKLTTSATAEVAVNFRRGMAVLRKLDAAVRNRVDDRELLHTWRLARSVELLHRPVPKYRLAAGSRRDAAAPEPPSVPDLEASRPVSSEEVKANVSVPTEERGPEQETLVSAEPTLPAEAPAPEASGLRLPAEAPLATPETEPEAAPAPESVPPPEAEPMLEKPAKPAKRTRSQTSKPIQDDFFGELGS